MDLFEADIIGGKSKKFLAKKQAVVRYGNCEEILDDIDGSKKIFRGRKRTIVRKFLDDNHLKVGDKVKLTRVAPYIYEFTKP
jgi:hypothetical protein